jgi:hypothetical protein
VPGALPHAKDRLCGDCRVSSAGTLQPRCTIWRIFEVVITLAYDRFRPCGFAVQRIRADATIGVPVRTRTFLDSLSFSLHRQTGDPLPAMRRRPQRSFARRSKRVADPKELNLMDATVGELAKYHVGAGIDDRALAESLRYQGFEVVWHERDTGARYLVTRSVLDRLKRTMTFRLLLRRPS